MSAGAGDSLFQNLLEATVAGLSGDISTTSTTTDSTLNASTVGSAPKAGASTTRKPGPSDDAQNQQIASVVPLNVPDQSVNPLFLGLFGITPVPLLLTDHSGAQAAAGTNSVVATDQLPAAAPNAMQTIVNASVPKNEAAAMTSQTAALASTAASTQPVFTLTIRPESDQQAPAAEPSTQSVKPGSPEPAPETPAVTSVSDTTPQATISVPATPTNASSNTTPASVAAPTTAPTTSVKIDPSESNSNNKSSDDQTGDRQLISPLVEPTTPPPTAGSETRFEVPQARPVTEYAASEQTASTHSSSPVTDIRLQVEGSANQHVNVRVVQEADGLRVSVRSNDPVLTQSLQERVPELTTRLEQHHYQAEVQLPERSESSHFAPANSGTNLQQDSSNRQHGSAGQGSSQHKQNQQQRQQTWDEEENFSSLLV